MTEDNAREDAARRYQIVNPGATFSEAMRAVTQPIGSQDIAQWWGLLTPGSREWLIEHNGEPLEPTVRAEILELNRGRKAESWWRGESDEGESELTDDAIDWIEAVANDED